MDIKSLILIATTLIAVLVTFSFVEPVPQDPVYHNFADRRTFWGIPNTLDVLSNIALAVVGFMGIIAALKGLGGSKFDATVFQYLVFFSGVFLTGLGSLYYHLAPSNETLHLISGHTLKHLFAAAAACCMLFRLSIIPRGSS